MRTPLVLGLIVFVLVNGAVGIAVEPAAGNVESCPARHPRQSPLQSHYLLTRCLRLFRHQPEGKGGTIMATEGATVAMGDATAGTAVVSGSRT